MALPLYLAMTAAELSSAEQIPEHFGWMACHFSPCSEGITNIPAALPPGGILILNDRMPCQGHSADLVTQQLKDALQRLNCDSVLLDFQRPPEPESEALVNALVDRLPCPVAVFERYAGELRCPVFLPPCPLHLPLTAHLAPWADREIWLEAALCQEEVTVTSEGVTYAQQFPPMPPETGFPDDLLCCHYRTELLENKVRFTLFDTPDSLQKKLTLARSLGVRRAVGLYQELGTFPTGKHCSGCSIA